MPRMALSEKERQYKAILAHIDQYTGARRRDGAKEEQICASMGMSYRLMYNRKKKPEDFRLRELQEIANVLNISTPVLLGYTDMKKDERG